MQPYVYDHKLYLLALPIAVSFEYAAYSLLDFCSVAKKILFWRNARA
jgi:hypothetical protein